MICSPCLEREIKGFIRDYNVTSQINFITALNVELFIITT